MAEAKKRRVYVLHKVIDSDVMNISVWSNLRKLYDFVKDKSRLPSYTTVTRKMQEEEEGYKFMMEDEVYRIIVKYLE